MCLALGGRACSMRCQGRGGEVGAEGRRDAPYAAEGGRAQCVMVGAVRDGRGMGQRPVCSGAGLGSQNKSPRAAGQAGACSTGTAI